MRLHRLEITAFGPFAGTVEVDFDDLSAAGVFLLTGATGAGKTSVLDAVCFALYGQVPGDRAGARHLRSDHAAPSLAPRVALEASVGDRRFRFTRSPAWSRRKQRGSGETRVPAHAVIEEHRDGSWVALTNRLDDAGLLVGDLLGMTATQFTQVAMLPQGRFQAFLRATSTERHAVLQRLFRTDRFERVERWLVERRLATGRASDEAADELRAVLHRIQEAAGTDLPDEWAADLTGAADRGEVAAWSRRLSDTAESERSAAEHGLTTAEAALAEAEADLAEVRRIRDLQARAESAAREIVSLERRGGELDQIRAELAAHRRAAPLTAVVAHASECRRRADRSASAWQSHLHVVAGIPDEEVPDRLATLHREAVGAHAVAEAFRPRARELGTLRARRVQMSTTASALSESLAALDEAIAEHPAALAAARAALDESRVAAAALPAGPRSVGDREDLQQAAARHGSVGTALASAREDLARARYGALAAKEAYLGVREARINGMAAELAGALAVGCACPVCGSSSHPAPAHGAGSAVGRAQEDAARKVHEDAAFVQQGHEVRVATLLAELDGLTARLAGVDTGSLPDRLRGERARLRATAALAAEAGDRSTRLRDLEVRADAARAARDRARTELATAESEIAATATAEKALADELDDLLDGSPDLDALLVARAARCEQLERAGRAFAAYDDARHAALAAERALHEAARDRGFDDVEEVAAALRSEEQVDDAERTLAAAEAARITAEKVLSDHATKAAVARQAPDLDVAVVRQRLATDTTRTATSVLDAATKRSHRLRALDLRVREQLDSWRPVREQHAVVAGLSQLVEGKGPDNPLRIRLAAYVLSERLRQVVDAANERLAAMTGRRYSLEHTDDRGAGEQRGGLSLLVRDDWNGISRDPATLSGGETFVVSLALALGLADTVAHEAGGTDIDTLFIDEGFGALDPDTLEDVMDTLDSLRDGGRVVGLVSHVPELRSRITTQLEVLKGRDGSTLRPVLAAG
jgi:exonuclease SbcC